MSWRDRIAGDLYQRKKRLGYHINRVFKSRLIVEVWFGGLGDHLFHSHLPRIAKESGAFKEVFVSNRSAWRDPAYRDLVWKPNPFVDGFTDASGFNRFNPNYLKPDEGNLLDHIMLLFGLDDGQRFHEPELFQNFDPRPEFAELTLYDPNYITNVGYDLTVEMVADFLQREGIKVDAQFSLRQKAIALPGIGQSIITRDLADFCSIIASCKQLICLTTGTATLAAALRKPCIVLYGSGVSNVFHHSRLHRYVRLGNRTDAAVSP